MEGETFAEKSANAVKELDTRMSLSGRDSAKWQRLLRTKGLVEGLIRFDRVEIPFEGEISESALAA